MYNRYLEHAEASAVPIREPGSDAPVLPKPAAESEAAPILPESMLPGAAGLWQKLRQTQLSGDDLVVLGVLLLSLRESGSQELLWTLGLLLLGS